MTLPRSAAGRRPAAAFLLAAAGVAVLPLVVGRAGLHPPCFDGPEAYWLAGGLGLAAFALAAGTTRGKSADELGRRLRRGGAGLVVATVAYIALFFNLSLPLPDHFHREIIGWSLTDHARQQLAEPLPKTIPDLVREWGSEVDQVFTPGSLAVVRAAFVGLWALLFVGVGVAAAVAATLAGRPAATAADGSQGTLSKAEWVDLKKALKDRFEGYELAQMLYERLEVELSHIVREGSKDEVVFELMKWADRHGRMDDLIAAAHAERPNDEALNRLWNDRRGRP